RCARAAGAGSGGAAKAARRGPQPRRWSPGRGGDRARHRGGAMTARGSALVPETVRLRALLDRVARRRLWTHAVTGAAAGLVAGSVAAAALRVAEAAPGGWAVFIALLGLVAGVAIGLARLRR